MKLIRLTESEEIPNTDQYTNPITNRKVTDSINELTRVMDLLEDNLDIPNKKVDPFYSYYRDELEKRLDIKVTDAKDRVGNLILDAWIDLHRLESMVRQGKVFDPRYRVPKRTNTTPLNNARRSVPNGKYIKKINNFEEYYILLNYAYNITFYLCDLRGVTNDFSRKVNSMCRTLAQAMDLADDFIQDSEEYQKELRAKNR